jgi:hypothetical protein
MEEFIDVPHEHTHNFDQLVGRIIKEVSFEPDNGRMRLKVKQKNYYIDFKELGSQFRVPFIVRDDGFDLQESRIMGFGFNRFDAKDGFGIEGYGMDIVLNNGKTTVFCPSKKAIRFIAYPENKLNYMNRYGVRPPASD